MSRRHQPTGLPSRRRVPVRHQLTPTECGAACLAMVATYYGRDTAVSECRDLVGGGRDGVSLARLLAAAPELGLVAEAVRVPDPWSAAGARAGSTATPGGPSIAPSSGPSIAFLTSRHFVVIDGASRRGVTVVDPAVGRLRQSRQDFLSRYSGVLIRLRPGPDFMPRQRRLRDLQLVRYLREFVTAPGGRRILAGVLVLAALLKALGLALPLATQMVVDRLVPAGRTDLLVPLAAAIGCTALLAGIVSAIRALAIVTLRSRVDAVMGRRFVRHLLRLPLPYFLQRTRGDMLLRLDSVSTTREIMTQQMLTLVLDTALLIGYVVGLALTAVEYLPVVAALIAVHAGVLLRAYPRVGSLAKRELAAKAEEQSYLVETLEAVAAVKANGAEARAEQRWFSMFARYQDAMVRRGRAAAWIDAAHQGLTTLAPLALLWLGLSLVLSGRMTLGTALAANAVALSVLAPVQTLTLLGQLYPTLRAQIERMYDVVDAAEEPTGTVRPATGKAAHLRLDGVEFAYQPDAPAVVSAISLTVEPGTKVGIVGRTGSGKSTLALLMLGLLRPRRGTISHDGIDLAELDVHALRSGCGVVLQDLTLFNGTVRDNLTLGRPDATDSDVAWACDIAGLTADIARLPLKDQTMVGEAGAALSAGQRQRLALARALIQRPRLLILDEATSHLDPQTERRVDAALSELDVTRIVISHRLSTIRNADQIAVIEQGHIVETGRHGDLIAADGIYHQLFGAEEPVRHAVTI